MREIEVLLRGKEEIIEDIDKLMREEKEALKKATEEGEIQFLRGYITACEVIEEAIRRSSLSNISNTEKIESK